MSSGNKQIIAKIPAREWRGLVPEMQGGRLRVAMTCHICGTTDHWVAAQMVGPQTAIPKVIHMGWSVDRKITCPACIAAKRSPQSAKVLTMAKPEVANITAAITKNNKNKRLVILALEEYFDETTKRYRAGSSDKSVSDELGVAEGFVKNVREEFYGQLAEPEDIGRFRSEIAAMQQGLDNLKRNFETMCHRNGWKV